MDYLVRLEQGRATHPSAQVVDSLARALQLDRIERDHLHRCAGLLPPPDRALDAPITPGIARMLTRLTEYPIAVFGADWQMHSWNPMWVALHGDPETVPPNCRNLIRALFGVDDRARSLFNPVVSSGGGEHFATALVADLRLASSIYPHDARLADLIAEMRSANDYFESLWVSGAVAVLCADRKTVTHPELGDITLDCDVLTSPGSDTRLVVYTAAEGSADADKLGSLRRGALSSDGPPTQSSSSSFEPDDHADRT